MKRNLLLFFLLGFQFAYAATGSANDELLFVLSLIAVLLFILATLYSISFFRKLIKELREKKHNKLNNADKGEDTELIS